MPASQIKIFKVPINQDSDFDIEGKSVEIINNFLKDDNVIYINHSTVVLTKDVKENAHIYTINKYLVISIVYKNLKELNLDVSKLSHKTKEKVISTHAKDEKATPKPNFKTETEKISITPKP